MVAVEHALIFWNSIQLLYFGSATVTRTVATAPSRGKLYSILIFLQLKIQINDTNYSYYKKIYEIIWSHFRTLFPPEILLESNDPVTILNSWEQKSKSIAKRGLKAGLHDLVLNIKEVSEDLKNSIDNDLLANELPSLRDLQGIAKKAIGRVLNRQKIKTLDEFYIVKEEVIDETSDLTNEDRALLDKLLTEFEFSKSKKKGI